MDDPLTITERGDPRDRITNQLPIKTKRLSTVTVEGEVYVHKHHYDALAETAEARTKEATRLYTERNQAHARARAAEAERDAAEKRVVELVEGHDLERLSAERDAAQEALREISQATTLADALIIARTTLAGNTGNTVRGTP